MAVFGDKDYDHEEYRPKKQQSFEKRYMLYAWIRGEKIEWRRLGNDQWQQLFSVHRVGLIEENLANYELRVAQSSVLNIFNRRTSMSKQNEEINIRFKPVHQEELTGKKIKAITKGFGNNLLLFTEDDCVVSIESFDHWGDIGGHVVKPDIDDVVNARYYILGCGVITQEEHDDWERQVEERSRKRDASRRLADIEARRKKYEELKSEFEQENNS